MRTLFRYPEGKAFAFSIVDDADDGTVANLRPVYDRLHDLGFRTTKTVWMRKGPNPDRLGACAQTMEDREYAEFVLELRNRGFEIAMHMAAPCTSRRSETVSAYEEFRRLFGRYPKINTNHYANAENIYWGRHRLDGALLQALYDRVARRAEFSGHIADSDLFWGDICQKHTKYVRNFAYLDVNTLKVNPGMPYHDDRRPYVNYWFSSSDGADVGKFNKLISERNQERLLKEGGCCLVYTHFGKGFAHGGKLDATWANLMAKLARKNGWFVPASTLLDFLLHQRKQERFSRRERWRLLFRWMLQRAWLRVADRMEDQALSLMKRR